MKEDEKGKKYTVQKEQPKHQRKDFLGGRGILPGDKIVNSEDLTESEKNAMGFIGSTQK